MIDKYLVTTKHFERLKPIVTQHVVTALSKPHAAEVYLKSKHHFVTESNIIKIQKLMKTSEDHHLRSKQSVHMPSRVTPKGGLLDISGYAKYVIKV